MEPILSVLRLRACGKGWACAAHSPTPPRSS